MKFLYTSTALILFSYFSAVYIISPYLTIYHTADRQIEAGEFEQAKLDCEGILQLSPGFFEKSATQKIGKIYIMAAQNALSAKEPDFQRALGWLQGLVRSGQTRPTGSEDLAKQLIQDLPKQHLNFTRDHLFFAQKDYQKSLREFAAISKMYEGWPEIQAEAKYFRGISQVELAGKMMREGHLEQSIKHFTDLLKSPDIPPLVIENHLYQIPGITEEACRSRMNHGEFASAFQLLDYVTNNLPHPVIREKLNNMRSKFEKEIFDNREIGYEYRLASVPVRVSTGQPTNFSTVNILIRNELPYAVSIYYRGLTMKEIVLAPGDEEEISMLPGEYLLANFADGKQHQVLPARNECRLEQGNYRQVLGL